MRISVLYYKLILLCDEFDLCLAFARPCLLPYKPQRKNTPPKTACWVGYSDLAEGKQSDVTNNSPIRHPVLTRYITLCSNLHTWPLRWKANSADLFTKFCRTRELHDCYVMLHPGPRAIIFMHFHFRNTINFPIVFLIVSSWKYVITNKIHSTKKMTTNPPIPSCLTHVLSARSLWQEQPYVIESGFQSRGFFCLWNLESGKNLLVESGILGFGIRNYISRNLESKFYWQRVRNPVAGIRDPWRGIQNPRLSWISLSNMKETVTRVDNT